MEHNTLIDYLPPYLKGYKEIQQITKAEASEIENLWSETGSVENNLFILSADSYGISRYEKLLKITPSSEDTLESRRNRVYVKWNDTIPYTIKVLINKLNTLCGKGNYTLVRNLDEHVIYVVTSLFMHGQTEALAELMDYIIPCNLSVNSENILDCKIEGNYNFGGGTVNVSMSQISDSFNEIYKSAGNANNASGTVLVDFIEINN